MVIGKGLFCLHHQEIHGYCATPPTAREVTAERIKQSKDSLADSNTLLGTLLSDSDCMPCTIFPTSFTNPVHCEENLISVDPRQEIFDSLAQEMERQHFDEPYQKFMIEKATMGKSSNKEWFIQRQKRLTASNFGSVIKRKVDIVPTSILKKYLEGNKFQLLQLVNGG